MERRPSLLPLAVWLVSLLLASPVLAAAAEFSLVSETLLRAFERNAGSDDDLAVPVYEYLQADVGTEGEQPLTFHFYGWGRVDLAGSDYFEERFAGGSDTAGEILYGYLQYDLPETDLTVRLGRQYVFAGVARESIDGLRLETPVSEWFSVMAYGGWPVGLDSTDGRSGDSIFGGRVAHHRSALYEVGLSYKNVENDGNLAEEMGGVDLSLLLPAGVSLFGYSTYNFETEGWAEDFYELRFSLGNFEIRPFFEHYNYEDYFATGDNTGSPFRFLTGTGENLTVFGSDLLWLQNESWEWGAKAKFYEYDERDDSSRYLAGLVTWHDGEGLTQAGGELGWMNGDTAETEYLLGRAYVYWDMPEAQVLKFLTGDLVTVWYDQSIYGEDLSFFVSAGGGTRLLQDALELRLSADYSSDPYFDDDLRGWLLARYTFSR